MWQRRPRGSGYGRGRRIVAWAVAAGAAVLCAAAGPPAAAWGQGGTETIVITGDPAPDGNGAFDEFLYAPMLNDAGQAAFTAALSLTSGGSSDDRGVFRGSGGPVTQIAREGQNAPDGNGVFSYFYNPALNNAGYAAFEASLTGTAGGSSDNSGIFRGYGVPVTQIAREGWAPPGGNGAFSGFGEPALNDAGHAAFDATLTGTSGGDSDNSGIFRGAGGLLTQIAREDQAAPDGNGTFSGFYEPALNQANQAAFHALLKGTSGGTSDNSGIFRGGGGTITQIAREDQAAPDGNGAFWFFHSPTLNGGDRVAFWARLDGTSGGDSDDTGIFRGGGGAITQIARQGQAAPDGNGAFSVLGSPALNDAGQAAFWAELTGTSGGTSDDRGVFRGSGGPITQIAREGQVAPDGNGAFSYFASAALNDGGQVAFRGSLDGTSGEASDDRGLFMGDGQQVLQVAREGQALEGSTITGLSAEFGLDVGGRSGLNAFGQIAYKATLADGRETIARFTPDLHYRKTSSGNWDDSTNWTVGIDPAEVHDVFIDPGAYVTVSGPGAPATTVKSLWVGGGGGSPRLDLGGGGDLTVSEGLIVLANGTLKQTGGTLTVAGYLNNLGDMTIGATTTVAAPIVNEGTLRVGGGGVLDAEEGLTNRSTMHLTGGWIDTGFGELVTNDFGALFHASGVVDSDLDNNGTMNLTGVLTVLGLTTNQGTVNIGTGQSLRPSGDLENDGAINLDGGGITGTGIVFNGPSGVIRGGSGISIGLVNDGGLIHADGTDTLVIEWFLNNLDGGELRIEDGAGMTVSTFGEEGSWTNDGTVVLRGPNARLQGSEIDNVGMIGGQGRVSNPVTNSGNVQASGGRLTLSGSPVTSDGLMEALQGATLLVTQGLAENEGSIALEGGTFDNQGPLTNSGYITGHGTLRSQGLTNNNLIGVGMGDMEVIGPVVNNGAVGVQAGDTVTFYGSVSGGGDFGGGGTVVFLADFSPGVSPAAVSFDGDVAFGAGAELRIELGGLDPGSEYDVLEVAGTATLAGTLEVALIEDFMPRLHDSFAIISFGDRQGDFAGYSGLDLGNGLWLQPRFESNSLVLSTVPEPSSLVLAALALLGLGLYGWRRRRT